MKKSYKLTTVLSLLVALLVFVDAGICIAQGGGHGGGGHEEGAGSNLSEPVIFAEGFGLTGLELDELLPETTGLRFWNSEPWYKLEGDFWYVWTDGAETQVCDPSQPDPVCPPVPAPSDLARVYTQRHEHNIWQADWLNGPLFQSPVQVSFIKWGDNLINHVWSTRQCQVRVEVGLSKDELDPELMAFEMQHLTGRGQTELWGAVTTDDATPLPQTYQSGVASVFSPCARLSIQKIVNDPGSPETPPDVELIWNPLNGEWDGAAHTLQNTAVWEMFGHDGPAFGISSEVNIQGKIIYGFNWPLRDVTLPPGTRKMGWYRLTFSLDGSSPYGNSCDAMTLNTSLSEAQLIAEAELGAEEEEDPLFTPVIDHENNLSYLDIYVAPAAGEDPTNHAPVCNAGGLLELSCTGVVTNVFLSAGGSYDIDGDSLSYEWSHNCAGGSMTGEGNINPVLGLTLPGQGTAQNCEVQLTVTELNLAEPLSSTCTAEINVSACPVDCFGTPYGEATLDMCGVCEGTNECLDCEGVPFGIQTYDRCGMCGGDGDSCLECINSDVSRQLVQIEQQTQNYLRMMRRAMLRIRRKSGKRRAHRKRYRRATRLVANNNEMTSGLPGVMSQCVNSFCLNAENTNTFGLLNRNTRRLHRQLRIMLKEASGLGLHRLYTRLSRDSLRARRRFRKALKELPETYSQC